MKKEFKNRSKMIMRYTIIIISMCFSLAYSAGFNPIPDREQNESEIQYQFRIATDLTIHPREQQAARKQIVWMKRNAIPFLLEKVNSNRLIDRQVAVILMGELGYIEFESVLIEISQANDFFVSEKAFNALAHLAYHYSPEEIQKRLDQSTDTHRAAIFYAVEARSDTLPEAFMDIAAANINSPSVALRTAVATCLQKSPKHVGLLLKQLETEDQPQVQLRLLKSIAVLRPADPGISVRPLMNSGNISVAIQAIKTMYALGYNEAIADLSHLVQNEPNMQAKQAAIYALVEINDPNTGSVLRRACRDELIGIRREAIRGLGMFGLMVHADQLQNALKDPSFEIRMLAAEGLVKLGVVGAEQSIKDVLLESENPDARIEALRAAGRLNGKIPLRYIGRFVSDANIEVACVAIEALTEIGTKEAAEILWVAMLIDKPAIRAYAREGLIRLLNDDPGDNKNHWQEFANKHALQ